MANTGFTAFLKKKGIIKSKTIPAKGKEAPKRGGKK